MTHTPGPWGVHPKLSASENHKGYRVADGDGFFVADVSPRDEDGDEGGANAHLIAAAPDLLAAVKAFLALDDGRAFAHESWDDARAAVKKARGG